MSCSGAERSQARAARAPASRVQRSVRRSPGSSVGLSHSRERRGSVQSGEFGSSVGYRGRRTPRHELTFVLLPGARMTGAGERGSRSRDARSPFSRSRTYRARARATWARYDMNSSQHHCFGYRRFIENRRRTSDRTIGIARRAPAWRAPLRNLSNPLPFCVRRGDHFGRHVSPSGERPAGGVLIPSSLGQRWGSTACIPGSGQQNPPKYWNL